MAMEFKKITLEDMINYIETNAPKEKAWFKAVAFDNNGKYSHLKAKRAFCEKFMPDIIPVKTEKANKSDILKNW